MPYYKLKRAFCIEKSKINAFVGSCWSYCSIRYWILFGKFEECYRLALGVEICADEVAEWAELREVIESDLLMPPPAPSDFALSFNFLNITTSE